MKKTAPSRYSPLWEQAAKNTEQREIIIKINPKILTLKSIFLFIEKHHFYHFTITENIEQSM